MPVSLIAVNMCCSFAPVGLCGSIRKSRETARFLIQSLSHIRKKPSPFHVTLPVRNYRYMSCIWHYGLYLPDELWQYGPCLAIFCCVDRQMTKQDLVTLEWPHQNMNEWIIWLKTVLSTCQVWLLQGLYNNQTTSHNCCFRLNDLNILKSVMSQTCAAIAMWILFTSDYDEL